MAWILASVLGPVCKRMLDGTIEEYRMVRDVNEEIMNLRRTVFVIMRKLEVAEGKQVDSHTIRLRLKELKQVLFDAEDVFDEIATDEALERDAEEGTSRQLKVRNPNIFGVDILLSRRAIAHRVKDINKKFDDILRDEEMLGLHVSNEPSESVDRPIRRTRQDTSSLLPKEARIIGRDDEMRKLEELLLEYSAEGTVAQTSDNYKNVHVISVVGMGGVGKTTLVQHAYNSPVVAEYFQPRMWVCASNDFDVKSITREIMEAAEFDSKKTRDKFVDPPNWDVVQKSLQNKLEGKRFLLVLDDVWEEDPSKWDSLCTPLMYGGKGSKIIVTTRSQKVASITKGTPISLEDLSNKYLWSIFQTYAFDGHDPDKNTQLVILGRKIVDQLKGSPLAAKTIGRLLNSNQDVKHWKYIMESKTWVSPDSKNSIVPMLKLSYDYLPGHLKQCFAYCSLFPEDHRFDKDELVKLWMAQQFIIQIKEGFFHVESDGGECFDDLVCMSLFEKCTYMCRERFVMHDLIHNLAEIVSEGDYLRLEDNQHNGTIPDTVRHVSIASGKFDQPKFEQLCNNYKNMRTLLFLRGCNFQLDHHLHNIFTKLQRLRVLGLSRCGIKELPASIGTLKHLRLLDLSHNSINNLPESLCNLYNLQVLNLDGCREIRALPRNMSALINLRHLIGERDIISECDRHSFLVSGIQGLGKLTALQELSFVCGMQPMKELADMGMLRLLRIRSLEKVKSREEAAGSRLDKKEHLDELTLVWSRGRDTHLINPGLEEEVLDSLQPPHSSIRELTIDDYGGTRSPSWMEDQSWLRDSCFLRSLKLLDCTNWEVLPPLGQLLCLDSLRISRMSSVRRIGPAFMGCCRQLPQGGFPSLQVLHIYYMKEWEEWEVPRETDIDDGGEVDQVLSQAPPLPLFLARLRELTIWGCPKLRQLPPLPPTLTKLEIRYSGLTHLPGWRLPPSSSLPCCCPSSSSSPYSLRSLYIKGCPNLEIDDDGEDDQVFSEAQQPPPRRHHLRPPLFLAPLQELTIKHCPKLKQLPPLPPTLTDLRIKYSGLTHLPGWRLPPSSSLPCCCPSSSSPYSLWWLEIDDCPNLEGDDDSEDNQVLSEAPPQQHHRRRPLFLAPLEKLTIRKCPKLRQLPPLPPTLTKLHIELVGLTHLPEWWLPPSSSSSSSCSSSPSLSSLEIVECPELTSLADGLLRHPLPNLVKLYIYNCEGLVSLPPDTAFGHLTSLKELVVMRCPKLAWPPPTLRRSLPSSLQELTIWENSQLDDETLSAWLRGLTSLRELSIRGCPAVTSLPRAEVLSHLTALKKLKITSLEALSSFGGGIHCLVSLEELIVNWKLEIMGSSNMQQIKTSLLHCPSLQELHISYCPQLTGFGGNHNDGGDDVGDQLEAALLNLSGTLQELIFDSCENLRSLPPRLRCLSSLQSLGIHHCRQIRSLPEAGLPDSLQNLYIYECHPELEERCEEGVGSDWPLISHIPDRWISSS